MFGFCGKKSIELEEKRKELERKKKQEIEKEQKKWKFANDIKRVIDEGCELTNKVYTKQNKQNVMLEELLELAEENEKAQETYLTQKKDYEGKEEQFTNTIIQYSEYLYQMERQSNGTGESWKEQIKLIRLEMSRQLNLCGIQEIVFGSEKADPLFCQIIETVQTGEQEKDNLIKEVVSPGYLLNGKVKKKSKVCIYKFEERYGCQK